MPWEVQVSSLVESMSGVHHIWDSGVQPQKEAAQAIVIAFRIPFTEHPNTIPYSQGIPPFYIILISKY